MEWRFIENRQLIHLNEIKRLMDESELVFMAVAYVMSSGVQLLEQSINRLKQRGGRLMVLFTEKFGFTEAAAIRTLTQLGAEIKCYSGGHIFHPKGYFFREMGLIRQSWGPRICREWH